MNLTISWRTIAITSTCTSLALAVVVAVLAHRTSVDSLSTLALALAVISFVVQIIVFIAQAATSSQQLLRAEEVHGLTTRALAAIEEKTEGTRVAVASISDRMLQAVIGKAVPEAEAKGVALDSPEFTQRLTDLIQRQVTTTASATSSTAVSVPALTRLGRDKLPVPSGDDLVSTIGAIKDLPGEDLYDLRRLGSDYLEYGPNSGSAIGHGIKTVSHGARLHDLGLVKRISVSWDGQPVWALTAAGLHAAALLSADTLPTEVGPEVRSIRQRMLEDRARVERLLATPEPDDDVPIESAENDDPTD